MVTTRRTQYLSNVCSKRSDASGIVNREDGCGVADGNGSSEHYSDLLIGRDDLVDCNVKKGGGGVVENGEIVVEGGKEMGDGGEVSRDDKCQFSVWKDEGLDDTFGGRGTCSGGEVVGQEGEENGEEGNDKVEGSDGDLEKTILQLTSMINDDDRSPSWVTQLINEAREVSTYQQTRTGDNKTCPGCRLNVTNNISGLLCDTCSTWYHKTCIKLDNVIDQCMVNTTEQWICYKCRVNCYQSIIHQKDKTRTTDNIDRHVEDNKHSVPVLQPSQSGNIAKRCTYCHKYVITTEDASGFCKECTVFLESSIRWGSYRGETQIVQKLDEIYKEIVTWRKNVFTIPRGKQGREVIEELTRLINLFNCKTRWFTVAMKQVMIFLPLMLQRPSPKSKPHQHSKFLEKRLKWWQEGDLDMLLKHSQDIQKQLKIIEFKAKQNKSKAFCRLMLAGNIKKAMKFINNEDPTAGVHRVTDEIETILKTKHPSPGNVVPEALLDGEDVVIPDSVIFEAIGADEIIKSAKNIDGSGGPTNIDAEIWRHMLCSKFHEKQSRSLATAISDLTKIMCTEELDPKILQELLASRLIPLDKNPGVRPIGVGEVLRRIIAKSVTSFLKSDIKLAAGSLQTCSGTEAGIEAAIHAVREIYEEDESECVLLIDADNAFNSLNRKVALHNVKVLCPSFHRFLSNVYQQPSKLFLIGTDQTSPDFILSEEGVTQGDPAAMAYYSIATWPLINKVSESQKHAQVPGKQAWFADDATAVGPLERVKEMWDVICTDGPKLGYNPKASKTVLIVKGEDNLSKARSLFGDTGITITTEGERHLGAAVGSEDFKISYVSNKVKKWVNDVTELSDIAKEEPQLAYSAFTKGLAHRWSYLQRTVADIDYLFEPLEQAIRNSLIPAIVGREVSDIERDMLALPLRHGGMGIQNPVIISQREYEASKSITEELKTLIYNQDTDLTKLNRDIISVKKAELRNTKDNWFKSEFDRIKYLTPTKEKQRAFEQASRKGVSSWLSCLPLQALGYCLNKQDFRNSVCLRYDWNIPGIHKYCACGENNDLNHTLVCKKGGYVYFRHNVLVETEAELLREAKCRNVQTEPPLLATAPELHPVGTITADGARLDIVATGLHGRNERTFMDVRVTHPNAPSNVTVTLDKLLLRNENEKKKKYNSRIINTEKATFIPLVFTTGGAVATECDKFHKRLANIIADKRRERVSHVLNYIRTKVRFSLLKSLLSAIHGVRDKRKYSNTINLADLSFGLIPTEKSYECR